MSLTLNVHPRDTHIKFDEPTHTYTIDGDNDYKSVTTWIHEFFPSFNADLIISKMRKGKNWGPTNQYYGKTTKEIKDGWNANGREAAELGTEMHLNIEYYYNSHPFNTGFTGTREYKLFQDYLSNHQQYKAFRTEWTIYSKKYRLAGSVDMVYTDPDNPDKIVIADWKRSKEIKYSNHWEKGLGPLKDIDNCNYWHYILQLNVYSMIIEKYYHLETTEMFLVILHPNQDSYVKIIIPKVTTPIMKMLKVRKRELNKTTV